MVASPIELAEVEKFFSSRDLPKVFKLHDAITFNDLPAYVKKVIDNLKSDQMSDAVARPRWDDLCEIKNILENNATE